MHAVVEWMWIGGGHADGDWSGDDDDTAIAFASGSS
jgi:hypothetical protein